MLSAGQVQTCATKRPTIGFPLATLTTRTDPRFVARARQPGLDLLRALAITLVIFYHAGLFGFSLPGRAERFGWIGVDLFFVLSGYLIAGQLLAPIARGESPNLRRFFWRRALRILPAYLLVAAVYFALPALREYPTIPPLWKFLLFVQNVGLRGGTAFSHAWSLCVEAQFYLVLPFVLIALARKRRAAMAAPCIVIGAGILLRASIAYSLATDGAVPFRGFQQLIYYATWTRLDPLTLGATLAAIQRFRPAWWTKLQDIAAWLWLVGLALIVFSLYLGESDSSPSPRPSGSFRCSPSASRPYSSVPSARGCLSHIVQFRARASSRVSPTASISAINSSFTPSPASAKRMRFPSRLPGDQPCHYCDPSGWCGALLRDRAPLLAVSTTFRSDSLGTLPLHPIRLSQRKTG